MADHPEIERATSSPPMPPVSSSAPILPSASQTPTTNLQRDSLTLRLPRTASANDRIENILEGARERAESISRNNSGDFGPKLQQPLLARSPQSNPGLGTLAESSVDDDHGDNGVVRTQPGRQHTLNYQSTHTSPSPRRRTAHSRRPSGQEHFQQIGLSGDGDGEQSEEESTEGRWRKRLRYFQSIELENKGSVARDHLALERTFLAWLRTSLAFASIGIAITQLFRLNTSLADSEVTQSDTLRHLGKPLGSTFLVISILILFLGYKRYLQAQHWVIRGKFPASRGTIMLVSFIAFAVTVASLVVVVTVQGSGR